MEAAEGAEADAAPVPTSSVPAPAAYVVVEPSGVRHRQARGGHREPFHGSRFRLHEGDLLAP
eukprot:10785605-Lingulodinium_polyedra.AAC.1